MDWGENMFLILSTSVKDDLILLLKARELTRIKKLNKIKQYLKILITIFKILNKITNKCNI